MANAGERLEAVRERVAAACKKAGRRTSEVTLLAVSKTFPSEVVREVFEAGQRDFGESRQQEAAIKMGQLPEGICWHFIGRLQRNKVRKVVVAFDWIHSVGSLRLAEACDRAAKETARRPRVFLEVNVAAEESKGGFRVEEIKSRAEELVGMTNLEVEGLMTVPPLGDDPARWFAALRELRDVLRGSAGMKLPGLSMGMSGDFETAILEGATVVRVGSAIFGERENSQ